METSLAAISDDDLPETGCGALGSLSRGQGGHPHEVPPVRLLCAPGALGASRLTPANQVIQEQQEPWQRLPGSRQTLCTCLRAWRAGSRGLGATPGPRWPGQCQLLAAIRSHSPDCVRGAACYRNVMWAVSLDGAAPVRLQ